MRVAVTICSRQKNEDVELLPACRRYTGEHIANTEKIAQELGLPFFILSGKYGLLPADEKIPNYDYHLETSTIDDLAEVMEEQLRKFNVNEIEFYTEGKESWIPYETALKKAAELASVTLNKHGL